MKRQEANIAGNGGGDTGNDCVGTSVRLGQICNTAGNDANAADRACCFQSMAGMAKGLKNRLWPEEAIAVFGHDPRVYQTTVTDFIKDKNGNVCRPGS